MRGEAGDSMSLVVETFRWCKSNEHWGRRYTSESDPDRTYLVTFHHGKWTCSCKGFKYHPTQTCKHIEKAMDDKCDHGWEAAAGSPLDDWPDGKCPACGQPAVPVRVAV